jgi:diguanylate cyclase (GGDEF)-like protein
MRWSHAIRFVPLSIALTCAAAVVQHRVILGINSLPMAVFVLPSALGASFGLLLAWAVAARDHLREVGRLDGLTGLANRTAFDEALAHETARAERHGTPFGVLVFDLDHFKAVNDTYGHPAGDAVLRTVAFLAASAVRSTDYLCRWGGDEFALIVPSTGLSGARVLAEKIRSVVSRHDFGLPGVDVTASIGLAQFVPGDDPETLLRRTDEALYRAKRNGRNCSATMRRLRPALIHS